MALKLDISKAYDRLEWTVLQQQLLKLSFATELVDLKMHCCITSVKYFILINGQPRLPREA